MDEINQSMFWKCIFFISSVTFCGFFVSLPTSIAIISMIILHCFAHSAVRIRLGHNCLGVLHLPVLGAISLHLGYVLYQKEKFLVSIAGPIAGLLCSLVFVFYCAFLNDPMFGEIAKILIILNFINLLPISFMDGSLICRSIGFSNGNFLGFALLISGMLILFFISIYHWFFIFFYVLSIVDLYLYIFKRIDARDMTRKEQSLSLMAYYIVISIFVILYSYVNEFRDTGAMTPFLLN